MSIVLDGWDRVKHVVLILLKKGAFQSRSTMKRWKNPIEL
jgi:hypothetical protein